jgi:hypothetical protein
MSYFLVGLRRCTQDDHLLRKRLPMIIGELIMAASCGFTSKVGANLIRAGHEPWCCAFLLRQGVAIDKNGMSAMDATVRMRLESGCRDIPFARGASCRTIEG